MLEFTKVPTQFPSKTAYNPKTVLIHMDTMKDICQELQDAVKILEEKVATLEGKATAKAKKE